MARAQWNFILWGLYFAVLLILEKYVFKAFLEKAPAIVQRVYTLFAVTVSFVLFNADSLEESIRNLKGMFGLLNIPFSGIETVYYLRSYGIVLLIAAIGATPLAAKAFRRLKEKNAGKYVMTFAEPVFLLAMMLLVTGHLVDGSFNPFLYFRF